MQKLTFVALSTIAATSMQAQKSCAGPGAAFGVTSFTCTNCLYQQKGDTIRWLFQAEPIVIAVDDKPLIIADGAVVEGGSRTTVRPGDIIEAINGKPITTSAGSNEFTFPPSGESRIAVRRGRNRETISVQAQSCRAASVSTTGPASDVRQDSILAAIAERVAATATPPKATATRIRTVTSHLTPREGEVFIESVIYGFAISCPPRCSRVFPAQNAPSYYMLPGEPKIIAIADDSPLKAVGVRVGDAIVEVNGGGFTPGESAAAKTLAWLDNYALVRMKIRLQSGTVENFELRWPRR